MSSTQTAESLQKENQVLTEKTAALKEKLGITKKEQQQEEKIESKNVSSFPLWLCWSCC
jgi:hypothetical protein